jgi:hypothetical protein
VLIVPKPVVFRAVLVYTITMSCKNDYVYFTNMKGLINMKFINTETKTYRVLTALQEGKALTASQAAKFGVKNLSAEVSRIRQHGFAVYTNNRKAGNGVQVTEYVLGKPSRNLVAAGYRALALGI